MAIQETLDQILRVLSSPKIAVNCPANPVEIPGITAANAFDANDCFGTLVELKVPRSGEIRSATFWDLDDENSQVDLLIFGHKIAQTASKDPWSPKDSDMLFFITQLDFVSSEDHDNSRTFELTNIGKAYSVPEGKFWIQAVCRGTPNIAAGQMPKFQLQILSFDLE